MDLNSVNIVAGGLLVLAVLTAILVITKSRAIARALGDVEGFLRAMGDHGAEARGLAGAVREHVVRDAVPWIH